MFICVNGVSSSLTTSQINKAHLPLLLARSFVLELELKNRVGSRTSSVGSRDSAGALEEPFPDHLHNLVDIKDRGLSQTYNVNLLLGVYSALEFRFVV